jgi:hypothetical protein
LIDRFLKPAATSLFSLSIVPMRRVDGGRAGQQAERQHRNYKQWREQSHGSLPRVSCRTVQAPAFESGRGNDVALHRDATEHEPVKRLVDHTESFRSIQREETPVGDLAALGANSER